MYKISLVFLTSLSFLFLVGLQETNLFRLVNGADLNQGQTLPFPWPASSHGNGPRIYITPSKQVFAVDASTISTKALTCQTAGDKPNMFGQLRWTGPNKTDNWVELSKKHSVTEETKNSNVWDLEFIKPTVDDAGIYYCFGDYQTTDSYNASIRVEVNTPIRLENCNELQSIELGSYNSKISCKITADGPRVTLYKDDVQITDKRYKWEGDGITISGPVLESDSGIYQIKVKSSSGEIRHPTIRVHVHWKPEISSSNGTLNGNQFFGVQGQQAKLTCLAKGNPRPIVYWQDPLLRNLTYRGGYIVNHEEGILTIERVNRVDDHGTFKCVAKNNMGSAEQNISMSVAVAPEITNFNNVTANEGDLVTFECRAKGDPKPNFSIRKYGLDQKAYQIFDSIVKDVAETPEGGQSLVYVYRLSIITDRKLFGKHYCNATNRFGTAETMADLSIRYKPDLSQTDSQQFTKFRTRLSIRCFVKAYPRPTVSFFVDNIKIINATIDHQTSPDGQSHVITMLPPPSASMEFRPITCQAENEMGQDFVVITPRYTTIPGPVNYYVKDRLPTSVILSMNVENDGGDRIKGFRYSLYGDTMEMHPTYKYPTDMRNETDLDATWVEKNTSEESLYIIKNLYPYYHYKMSVRAWNQVGDGHPTEISFQTTKPTRPPPPIIINSSNTSTLQHKSLISDYQDGFLLRWSPPDTDNGDPIYKYFINYQRTDDNKVYPTVEIEQLNERPLNARLGPLEPDSHYRISLYAANNYGRSDPTHIEIYTSSQRPSMAEFSSYLVITVLIAVVISMIIIDLIFCFCFQMGLSHSARKKGLQLFNAEDR